MNQRFRRLPLVAFFVLLVVFLAVPTTSWAASEQPSEVSQVNYLGDEPITAFRMRMMVRVSGDAFDTIEFTGAGITGATIEAAFTKIPPAAQMVFKIDENLGVTEDLELIQVDGKTYANLDGEWVESPTEELGNITDVFEIVETDARTDLEGLEFVGNEMLNGRSVLRYRAPKELFETLDPVGIDPNINTVILNGDMSIQFDVWIDEARGFLTKIEAVVEGKGFNEAIPEATGRIDITMELYDFNGNITITAPVNGQASAPTPMPTQPTPEPTPEPMPEPMPEPTASPDLAPQPASAPQAPAEVGPMTRSIWGKVKK